MADSKSTGVAYSDPTLTNAVLVSCTVTTPTITDLSTTGNTALGDAATDTIGLYGVTKVSQAAAITAVGTSAPITAGFGFTTTQAAALIAAVNSLITAVKNIGITA